MRARADRLGRLHRHPSGEGRRPERDGVVALHALVGCALAVGVAGAVALATGQAWLFPSLGPTALLQTEQPGAPASSPRNTLIGHAVALAAGYGSLRAFGLASAGPALSTGVDGRRLAAAALSLAVTAAVLVLLRSGHPPAGATTLIVSLGLLRTPASLVVAMASVVLVTAVDWAYARATSAPMPLWAAAAAAPRRS